MKTALSCLAFSILVGCVAARSPKPVRPEEAPAPPGAPSTVIRLAPAHEGLARQGLWRENLALADVNNDGFVDLVAPPPRGESQKPVVFLGNGSGQWMEWTEARFPDLPLAYGGVAVGDIDLNGFPDIVVAGHLARIYALFQVSAGVFESRSEGFPSPDKFSSKAVALADLTGDGRLELIAINENPTYPNQSTLNLTRQMVFAFDGARWSPIPVVAGKGETMAFGNALTVRDFDGDGRLDFATGSSMFNYQHILFINQPDGFHPTPIPALPYRSYTFYVDSADFDGDGRMDLAGTAMVFPIDETDVNAQIAGVFSKVFLLLNRAEGWAYQELAARDVTKTKLRFRGLVAADFDRNGFPDLATVFDDRTLHIYLNLDGKTFRLASVEGWIPQGRASWLGSADFNGDGGPDLAVAYGTEKDGGWIHVYTVEVK